MVLTEHIWLHWLVKQTPEQVVESLSAGPCPSILPHLPPPRPAPPLHVPAVLACLWPSQGAAFSKYCVSSTQNLPLLWKSSVYILQNSAHLSLSPYSIFCRPIPMSAWIIFAVWMPCVRLCFVQYAVPDAFVWLSPCYDPPEPIQLFRC